MKLENPFLSPFLWTSEVKLQKWGVSGTTGQTGCPWSAHFSLQGIFFRGVSTKTGAKMMWRAWDCEKSLSYLSPDLWALINHCAKLAPSRGSEFPHPSGCAHAEVLKGFLVVLRVQVPIRVYSYGAALSSSHPPLPPPSPQTNVTLEHWVSICRFTVYLHWPSWTLPEIWPVQEDFPWHAVDWENSLEKQPGGASGTFLSASALHFESKLGSAEITEGEKWLH